ncbi:hypothetical protein RvY_16639 [Ramazzottius varieornatus]|uniref:Uncharacterized protein n=1 Tax=Ramazzottius varieornatus TaxID=947166 RepID=A0A1D1W1X0_RAMVA|nr:hypothetical protein RvY_16639 [Ramazzottius varieornatus]
MLRISPWLSILVAAVYGQMTTGSVSSSSAMPMMGGTQAADYGSSAYSDSYYTTAAPPSCLPTKPAPVNGSTVPTSDSFTATSGIPFDFVSGISIRQLDIVRNQTAKIFQMAAQAAFVDVSQGPDLFGSIVNYIQTLWYPNDAKKAGLPYPVVGSESAGPLRGGSALSKESYWESSAAQALSTAYGRSISERLDHLLGFDPVGYARVESDVTYKSYLQYRSSGFKIGDVIHIYLHRTIQQTAAADYVMGPLSDEVHSALKTVFRYINWHAAIQADLYLKRIYQRYEGLEDDDCLDISYADLTPSELRYPIPKNSSAKINILVQATDANRTFGPVTPAGTAKASTLPTARMFSDRTQAGHDFNMKLDLIEGKALKVSAEMFPRPQAAEGSTPLTPAPYSATVNKTVDRYTGISVDQLALAYATWRNLTRAAAASAGVNETEGAKIFVKQSEYTFLLWHFEYKAVSGVVGVDDLWNSAAKDQAAASSAA